MSNGPQSFPDVDRYRRGNCNIVLTSESWNKKIKEEGNVEENPNSTAHEQSSIGEMPHLSTK